jgi:hypothetical protein
LTYIGQQPATTFDAGIQDRFTGLSSNTVTLTHEIAAEEDILVVWNNIVQDKNTYSVGGTGNKTLTLGGTLVSADVVTVYYLNKVMQSVNPTAGSVTTATINDTAVTAAKFNADVISGQTELATTPADTDEFLISDAGVLKRIDYSHLKSATHVQTAKVFYETSASSSSATLTDCFTNDYDHYVMYLYLVAASNGAEVRMRFINSGGTEVDGSNYDYSSRYFDSSGGSGSSTGEGQAQIVIANSISSNPSDSPLSGIFHFAVNRNHSSTGQAPAFNCNGQYLVRDTNSDRTSRAYYHASAYRDSLSNHVPEDLKIYMGAGNIEQINVRMYGIKGSNS